MKVIVQRKVKVWIQEVYEVDNISTETIKNLIDYNEDCCELETLWDTQEDLGPVEVCDENWNVLYSNIEK